MRAKPSRELLWLVPSPAGAAVFFLQEKWLAGLIAAGLFALLTAFIHDVHRSGGFWRWIQRAIETADKLEEFLNRRAERRGERRRRRVEDENELRELEGRGSSWWGQLRLFR
jgi:hypothetical protein